MTWACGPRGHPPIARSDIAALGLFDLAFHYVERVVYRLLECACLLLYAQVAAGYVECNYCDLVTSFVVLVDCFI